MLLQKEVLRPGLHIKRGLDGKEISRSTITTKDITDLASSFNELKTKGLFGPLVYEHPERSLNGLGTPQPLQSLKDRKSDQTAKTAGYADSVSIRDGRLWAKFEIPDAEAQPFLDKRIRYISPEIRKSWVDADGVEHKNVIAHFAATHMPVIKNQDVGFAPVPVVQLSDGIYQYADDDEQTDMPPDGGAESDDKAIIANLAALGVELPVDIDLSSKEGKAALLAGLKTKVAAKAEADKNNSAEPEQEPVITMSENEVKLKKQLDGALLQLTNKNRGSLRDKLNRSHAPQQLKKKYAGIVDVVQFSDAGEEEPKLKLSEVIDDFDRFVPPGLVYELSETTTGKHPDENFNVDTVTGNSTKDEKVGLKQGQDFRDAELKRRGIPVA